MDETSPRAAVTALVAALTAGQLSEDAFIARLIAMPVVQQLPAAPEGSDSGARSDGPVRVVRLEAMNGAISPQLAARATTAMVASGHQA